MDFNEPVVDEDYYTKEDFADRTKDWSSSTQLTPSSIPSYSKDPHGFVLRG